MSVGVWSVSGESSVQSGAAAPKRLRVYWAASGMIMVLGASNAARPCERRVPRHCEWIGLLGGGLGLSGR